MCIFWYQSGGKEDESCKMWLMTLSCISMAKAKAKNDDTSFAPLPYLYNSWFFFWWWRTPLKLLFFFIESNQSDWINKISEPMNHYINWNQKSNFYKVLISLKLKPISLKIPHLLLYKLLWRNSWLLFDIAMFDSW